VDLFIGHSWKAGRWEKFFSLCTSLGIQFDVSNASEATTHISSQVKIRSKPVVVGSHA
jgi:hypothetical protein